MTRLKGCLTKVVETIVFPHNSGIPWSRDIQYLPGQSVNSTSISVSREGRPTNFTFDNKTRVTVSAQKSDGPVRFDLTYIMINGVTRYTGRCDFSNDGDVDDSGTVKNPEYNLLFWSVGELDKDVDSLTVSFRTENEKAPLRFANLEEHSEVGLAVSTTKRNVSTALRFYALENTTQLCTLDYKCSSSESVKWWFWVIISLVVVVACICGLCGGGSGGGGSGGGSFGGGGSACGGYGY